MVRVAVFPLYVCVVLVGLPLSVLVVPSPQLISHDEIVSAPGSLFERLSVYSEPALTLLGPLMVSVGATLVTVTLLELALYVPSSSVAVAVMV